jgi:hypothetical protein
MECKEFIEIGVECIVRPGEVGAIWPAASDTFVPVTAIRLAADENSPGVSSFSDRQNYLPGYMERILSFSILTVTT